MTACWVRNKARTATMFSATISVFSILVVPRLFVKPTRTIVRLSTTFSSLYVAHFHFFWAFISATDLMCCWLALLLLLLLSALVDGFELHHNRNHPVSHAASVAATVDDAIITMDNTPGQAAAKIKIQRFHETWMWTYRDRTYHINYRVEGTKFAQPILLTHGFGANLNHFRYNIRSLVDAGYRVYAMDLLGFGASEKPTQANTVGFSVELFSQQIVDFIAYQRLEEEEEVVDGGLERPKPWILAGNSIGGTINTSLFILFFGANFGIQVTVRLCHRDDFFHSFICFLFCVLP
jgi:hypothetical protein